MAMLTETFDTYELINTYYLMKFTMWAVRKRTHGVTSNNVDTCNALLDMNGEKSRDYKVTTFKSTC